MIACMVRVFKARIMEIESEINGFAMAVLAQQSWV